MKLSIVFWNNHSDASLKKTLPRNIGRSLEINETRNFNRVLELLEGNSDIEMVLATLQPTDLQTFCHLQQLRQHYPNVAVIVIIDSMLRLTTVTKLLQRMMGKSAKNLKKLEIDASQETGESNSQDTTGDIAEWIAEEDDEPLHLTPRQLDVLSLLMHGKSNKEIARLLDLSEGTVKIHCMAIFKQLGVANRTQAVIRAEQILPKLRAMQSKPEVSQQH